MTAPANTNKSSKVSTYFKGVKSEMKKVIWPSKKELINYTGVVIMISAIVAITVGILDLIIHSGLSLIM